MMISLKKCKEDSMMKRFLYISLITLVATTACQKGILDDTISSQEIVISVDASPISSTVTTKTSEITSIPSSLYFAGTKGSSSSQTSKWSSVSKTVSSGKISTGYYQTNPATAYNYYLSNMPMTVTTSGCTISADGTATDVLVGITTGSSSVTPSVKLNHLFARTGTLSVTSSTGYTISNLSVTIQSNSGAGYKGTYNIYTGGWSNVTGLSATTLTSSSDRYLIPGSYKITVSCTRTLGTYSASFSGSTDITLVGGHKNNISISLTGDPATPIVATANITAWGTTTLSGTAS